MKTLLLMSAALFCCSLGVHASDPETSAFPADGKTLYVELRILHDGELLGAPKLLVRSGEKFKVAIGAEGKNAFWMEAVSRVDDAEQVVTDFTYENTHWTGPVKQTRRIAQAVRSALDKDFVMVESPGENGGSEVLMFKISRPDANTLKFRAQ